MSKLPSSPIPLFKIKVQEKGRIRDIKEIIVRVEGLPSCLNGQIVDLGEGVKGIIMGYDEHDVLVLVLGEPGKLRMGNEVLSISEPFKIPVGEKFIGRAITALGSPCDRRGDAEQRHAPARVLSPARRKPHRDFALGRLVHHHQEFADCGRGHGADRLF